MENANIFYCLLLCVLNLTTGTHDYYWKDYRNDLPGDAISFHGIFVAQVPYNGLLPASFYPATKTAVTESNGKKVVITKGIKVLCDSNVSNFLWEYTSANTLTGDVLDSLVIGGVEDNSIIYIGKIYHEGQWKIGKVFPPTSEWKGFRGWFNNDSKLYATNDFQILKYEPHPVSN